MHMGNPGLTNDSNLFLKEGGIVKSYTIIQGRYCVAIVKFVIGCFGL